MPEMDGFTVLKFEIPNYAQASKILNEKFEDGTISRCKIIALTAYVSEEAVEESQKSGMSGFCKKF